MDAIRQRRWREDVELPGTEEQRRAMLRALGKKGGKLGGRPRTVMHSSINPESCRCVDCLKLRRAYPFNGKKSRIDRMFS
jgi:hypothetical protein